MKKQGKARVYVHGYHIRTLWTSGGLLWATLWLLNNMLIYCRIYCQRKHDIWLFIWACSGRTAHWLWSALSSSAGMLRSTKEMSHMPTTPDEDSSNLLAQEDMKPPLWAVGAAKERTLPTYIIQTAHGTLHPHGKGLLPTWPENQALRESQWETLQAEQIFPAPRTEQAGHFVPHTVKLPPWEESSWQWQKHLLLERFIQALVWPTEDISITLFILVGKENELTIFHFVLLLSK